MAGEFWVIVPITAPLLLSPTSPLMSPPHALSPTSILQCNPSTFLSNVTPSMPSIECHPQRAPKCHHRRLSPTYHTSKSPSNFTPPTSSERASPDVPLQRHPQHACPMCLPTPSPAKSKITCHGRLPSVALREGYGWQVRSF